jgi:hypothetical protein
LKTGGDCYIINKVRRALAETQRHPLEKWREQAAQRLIAADENGQDRASVVSGSTHALFCRLPDCDLGVFKDAGTEGNDRRGAPVMGRWLFDIVGLSVDAIDSDLAYVVNSRSVV